MYRLLLSSRLYCRLRNLTESCGFPELRPSENARGLYRRWGIAPRPEDFKLPLLLYYIPVKSKDCIFLTDDNFRRGCTPLQSAVSGTPWWSRYSARSSASRNSKMGSGIFPCWCSRCIWCPAPSSPYASAASWRNTSCRSSGCGIRSYLRRWWICSPRWHSRS